MRIGIDMDEVLADHTGSFNVFHDTKYGTDLQNMDINEFFLRDLIGITPEQEMDRIVEYYHTDDFLNMKPVAGAVEAIKELTKKHELYVITSRPDSLPKSPKIGSTNISRAASRNLLFSIIILAGQGRRRSLKLAKS